MIPITDETECRVLNLKILIFSVFCVILSIKLQLIGIYVIEKLFFANIWQTLKKMDFLLSI